MSHVNLGEDDYKIKGKRLFGDDTEKIERWAKAFGYKTESEPEKPKYAMEFKEKIHGHKEHEPKHEPKPEPKHEPKPEPEPKLSRFTLESRIYNKKQKEYDELFPHKDNSVALTGYMMKLGMLDYDELVNELKSLSK